MIKQDTSNTAQAMWIGIGSLASFLFAIISSAILSRFLIKSDYGTYKQVMYVYNTLLSVFTLGLPLAYSYFLPRVNRSEGKALVEKLNLVFVVLGFIFSVVLFFGSDTIASLLNNSDLSKNLKIFSPAPILILPTMGLQGILATYKRTIWNAVYIVSTRILMLLFVALPVALYRSDCEIAIWGFVIASFISLLLSLTLQNIPFKGIKKESCSITYKEIFNYSIPLMAASFLGIGIGAADQFYISRFFGQEIFADFANGSLELPFVGMVLSASATVLLPTFSKMISEGDDTSAIVDLWKRTAIKSAYIIYPLVTYFGFFAFDTMTFIYGDQYEQSSIYFQISLLVNFFTVIPFYPLILALGKTRDYANVHIVIFLVVWIAEFMSVKTINSAYAISVISVLCKITKAVLLFKIVAEAIHLSLRSLLPLRQLLTMLISCLFVGAVSCYMVHLLPFANNKLFSLMVGFVIFVVLTLLVSKPLKLNYFDVIQPLLKNIRKKNDKY